LRTLRETAERFLHDGIAALRFLLLSLVRRLVGFFPGDQEQKNQHDGEENDDGEYR